MDAKIPQALRAARTIADPLMQKLAVMAAITKALEPQRIRPVVVGGTAVAFYTLGGYSTQVIDLAVIGREQFAEVLAQLGFVKQGRLWLHPDFDFPIEAPASSLAGEDAPLTTTDVNGWPVYIIGIEDLIIDRLNAAVHWKSQADAQWASQLATLQKDRINWRYLASKAREHGVLNALNALRRRLSRHA